MAFFDHLLQGSKSVREAILRHPFVTGIGDGSLPVEKFKYYISQDYAYLIDYSRVLALASARAPDPNTMGWFARLLDETLNTEMALHRSYCAQFSITDRELEETQAAPTTLAYTRFLLSTAYHGSFAEIATSLAPCQWGYWEIGEYLAKRGEPREHPLYCEWIRMYSSPEFQHLAQELRGLVDRLAASAGDAEKVRMEQAFTTSLRLEHLFWEASYNQEAWPV